VINKTPFFVYSIINMYRKLKWTVLSSLDIGSLYYRGGQLASRVMYLLIIIIINLVFYWHTFIKHLALDIIVFIQWLTNIFMLATLAILYIFNTYKMIYKTWFSIFFIYYIIYTSKKFSNFFRLNVSYPNDYYL